MLRVIDVDYLETQIMTENGPTEGPSIPVLIMEDNAQNIYRIETSNVTVESVTEIFNALEETRTTA